MSQSTTAQNLSFVLEGVHQVKFEDRPIPELRDPYDVLVNVRYTGICGSDVRPTGKLLSLELTDWIHRSTIGSTARSASSW